MLLFSAFFTVMYTLLGTILPTSKLQSEVRPFVSTTLRGSGIESVLVIHDRSLVMGQPVIVTLEVTNRNNHEVELDFGRNRKEAFAFKLVLPNGRIRSAPQIRGEGFAGGGLVSIKPYSTHRQTLVLNEWFTFPVFGKYVLTSQILLTDPKRDRIAKSLKPPPPLEFQIGQHDSYKLSEVSKNLLDDILRYRSYEEATTAAVALCYVLDPVAIPYLEEALTANVMVDSVIINTLKAIGGNRSADVLIRSLERRPAAEWAKIARSTLQSIEASVSDPALRQRIRNIRSEPDR